MLENDEEEAEESAKSNDFRTAFEWYFNGENVAAAQPLTSTNTATTNNDNDNDRNMFFFVY